MRVAWLRRYRQSLNGSAPSSRACATFVHSGNECAFTNCDRALVNHKEQWVGEVCHVKAASASAIVGRVKVASVSRDEPVLREPVSRSLV
jgi:hypothetical protein